MHPIEWLRTVARSGDVPQAELVSEAAAALSALGDDPQGLLMGCRRLLDRHPTAGALWWACARMVSSADAATEARAVQDDLAADQVGLSLTLDLPDDVAVSLVGWSALADEVAARRGDLRLLVVAPGQGDGDGDELGGRAGLGGYGGRSSWFGGGGPSGRPGRGGRARGHRRGSLGSHLTGPDRDVGLGGPGPALDDEDDEATRLQVVPPAQLGAAVVASDVVLVEAWAVGDGSFLGAPGSLAAAAVARQRRAEVWLAVGVGRRLPESLFATVRRRVLGGARDAAGAAAETDRAALPASAVDLVELSLVDRVVEPIGIGCPAPPELLRLA